MVILLVLTIGLAPYAPEPHIWGKIKWIAGGTSGMKFMDWFDVLLHGFPYLLLLRLVARSVCKKSGEPSNHLK